MTFKGTARHPGQLADVAKERFEAAARLVGRLDFHPVFAVNLQNAEVYLILEGKGMLYIDGEELPLKEGDCFRIDPQGERCLRAADDSAMRFICIQAKAGSLEGFTMSDAVVTESGSKPSWL